MVILTFNEETSEVNVRFLFAVFDSNRDGSLRKDEFNELLDIFTVIRQEDDTINQEKLKNFVNEVFGEKTELLFDGFRQILQNKQTFEEIAEFCR